MLDYFICGTLKIMLLVCAASHVVAIIRSGFSPERTKRILPLDRKHAGTGEEGRSVFPGMPALVEDVAGML